MAVTAVPATWNFTCDGCGEVEVKKDAHRPNRWGALEMDKDGEWSSEGRKWLFCDRCARTVMTAIDNQAKALKK